MAGAGGTEVGRISIKVSPDTDNFRRDLQSDLAAIERSVEATVTVKAELDSTGVIEQFRLLMFQLRKMARGVVITPDFDGGFALAQMAALLAQMRAMAMLSPSIRPDVGGSLGGASGALSPPGIGSLASVAPMMAAIAAAIAPVIGLVSGLLAGLPSLVSSFGAAAGAVYLGLDGIKAAAEGLVPELDALKASVSGVFEERLTPIFDQLRSIFPVLEAGMSEVAQGVSDFFGGFTNALTSGAGIENLTNILSQTRVLFSELAPVIETAMGSFLTLASAGASSFGLLTGSLSTFATGFDEMVDRVTSNGVFEGAMQGLSQTLDGLTSMFTRLMESGLTAMSQLGGPLNTLLTGITDVLVAAMPALTSFSTLVADVLGAALSNLGPVIEALTPALTLMAETMGTNLVNAIDAFAPALTMIAEQIGPMLVSHFEAMQPVLPVLAQAFSDIATALGEAFVTSLQAIAPYLPQLSEAFAQIATALIPLIPQIVTLALSFQDIQLAALQVFPAFVEFAQIAADLATQVAPLVSVMLDVAAALAGELSSALAGVVGYVADLVVKSAEWVSSFTSAVGDVIAKAQEIGPEILAAVSNFGSLLISAGSDLIQGLINGITSRIQDAIATVQSMGSQIADAARSVLGINSPSRVFKEIGGYIGDGLAEGITESTSKVMKATHDMVGKAMDVPDLTTSADQFGTMTGSAMNIPIDFAKATGQQFLSDLGISGNGFIPQLLTQGAQYVFQIGSVDEALSIKDREESKQALSIVGR